MKLNFKKITDSIKNTGIRKILFCILGNTILALGVCFLRLASLGNDPFNGMAMAIGDITVLSFATFVLLLNVALFVLELVFGKRFIGIGTFINWFLCPYAVTFFLWLFGKHIIGYPENFAVRLIILICGVLITSFGLSIYQTADIGIAPYDSLSLIMHEKFSKIPYFWCRMSNDAVCALVCFLCGGIINIGTLVSAFGLGPVIHFFNRTFVEKMINKNKPSIKKA